MQQLRAGGALQHVVRSLLGAHALPCCTQWLSYSTLEPAAPASSSSEASATAADTAYDSSSSSNATSTTTTSDGTSSSSSTNASSATAAASTPSSSDDNVSPGSIAEPSPELSQLSALGDERMDRLMRVLLHPISRTRRWTGQLNPYLVHVNGQLFVEPQAVLTSMLRALHVVRGVLEEDGHIYVVETNPLLRPLLREAARSCINPNLWFMETTWSRGMISNHASHRRLFLPAHQPNRRLFIEKGVRMVNPYHPEPQGPPPRLDWKDKWALYARSHQPGYRDLLNTLLQAEQELHSLKPPRTLNGRARDLRLLIMLDTTRNSIALREAAQRSIPTIALASGQVDMSAVTYPVLARDFSPEFVHFFLDMLIKVANVAPQDERGEEERGEQKHVQGAQGQ